MCFIFFKLVCIGVFGNCSYMIFNWNINYDVEMSSDMLEVIEFKIRVIFWNDWECSVGNGWRIYEEVGGGFFGRDLG